MKQVSQRQLELLLDFVGQHQSLAMGQLRGKEGSGLSKRLWTQCAEILNSDVGGVQKTVEYWKKYYNQYKSKSKAKLRAIKQRLNKTDRCTAGVFLTPLENRLIEIVGGCDSPLPANSHDALEAVDVAARSGENSESGGSCGDSSHVNKDFDKEEEDCFPVCNKEEKSEVPKKRGCYDGENTSSPKAKKEVNEIQGLLALEEYRLEIAKKQLHCIQRLTTAVESIASGFNRFLDGLPGGSSSPILTAGYGSRIFHHYATQNILKRKPKQ